MTFRAAIIGLGNIGMGRVPQRTGASAVLSHADALQAHGSFDLAAGVDTDIRRRKDFSRRFGVEAFESVSQMAISESPDLVVLSVPTEDHSSVLRETLQTLGPSFVLLEKPTSRSSQDDEAISALSADSGATIVINYLRRVDPSFLAVKKLIASNKLLPPYEGICWYTNGLYNSASHFLDLLFGWFGEFHCSSITSLQSRPNGDFDAEFTVIGEDVKVRFVPLDEGNFSHASLELFSSTGRLVYDRGGEKVSTSFVGTHFLHPDLLTLTPNEVVLPSFPSELMLRVYDDIHNQMAGLGGSLPSLNEALRVNELLHSVAKRTRGN